MVPMSEVTLIQHHLYAYVGTGGCEDHRFLTCSYCNQNYRGLQDHGGVRCTGLGQKLMLSPGMNCASSEPCPHHCARARPEGLFCLRPSKGIGQPFGDSNLKYVEKGAHAIRDLARLGAGLKSREDF